MTEITSSQRSTGFRRRVGLALGAGLLLVGFAAATASAKETASGGAPATGGVSAACQPVTSLTAKGDPRVGELATSSISVSYGVKPCVNGQAVSVAVSVSEYLDPTAVVYANANAPQNGKFVAFGVKVRTSYVVTVAVYDAATSELVGQLSVYAAAIPKGV